jgi:hypothetical protein
VLHCVWVDIIKADITLLVCDSVTWVICAPNLRTDHFRLRWQKDQRASPRIRLMYKAEMRTVCCQRHTAEARLFQSRSAGCKAVPGRQQFVPTSSALSYSQRPETTQSARVAACCSCSLTSAIRLLPYRNIPSSNIKIYTVFSTTFSKTHSPSLYLKFRPLYLYLRNTFTRRTSGEKKENLQTSKFSLSLLFVTQLYIFIFLRLNTFRVASNGGLCVKVGHVEF